MALKRNFDLGDLKEDAQNQSDELHKKILESFFRAGEIFITQARQQVQSHSLGTYEDKTTNLRNSIGYYVFKDGEKMGGESGEALKSLEDVLSRVVPNGYQLIAIAGMNYASYVEAKGYNVISSQAETMFLNLSNFLEILQAKEKGYNEKLQEQINVGANDYYDAGL